MLVAKVKVTVSSDVLLPSASRHRSPWLLHCRRKLSDTNVNPGAKPDDWFGLSGSACAEWLPLARHTACSVARNAPFQLAIQSILQRETHRSAMSSGPNRHGILSNSFWGVLACSSDKGKYGILLRGRSAVSSGELVSLWSGIYNCVGRLFV